MEHGPRFALVFRGIPTSGSDLLRGGLAQVVLAGLERKRRKGREDFVLHRRVPRGGLVEVHDGVAEELPKPQRHTAHQGKNEESFHGNFKKRFAPKYVKISLPCSELRSPWRTF